MKVAKLLDMLVGKKIKVGAHTLDVRVTEKGEPLIGPNGPCAAWFYPLENEFAFDRDYAIPRPATALVESLIHELVHAGWWAMRLDMKRKVPEEELTECQGRALTGILVDNPWLRDWINKGLK